MKLAVLLCAGSILSSRISGNNHAKSVSGDDSKIVGGFPLYLRNAPFATSLQEKGNHFCGGALLTLSVVLTGCHCLTTIEKGTRHEEIRLRSTQFLKAVVGAENIVTPEASEHFQTRDITQIKIHPECSYVEIMVFDFAVGYFRSPLTESVKVKPFKMYAYTREEYSDKIRDLVNSDKVDCYVAGWGTVDPIVRKANPFIKAARMRVITDNECSLRLGRENIKFISHNFEENAMMCSLPHGYRKNESDCTGDSGGPFFCGPTVYGIVSFGYDCGAWDSPNVYSKVSGSVEWLLSLGVFPQKIINEEKKRSLSKNQIAISRKSNKMMSLLAAFVLIKRC